MDKYNCTTFEILIAFVSRAHFKRQKTEEKEGLDEKMSGLGEGVATENESFFLNALKAQIH